MTEEELRQIQYDAEKILSHATALAFKDLAEKWTHEREMGFIMVRRALRRMIFGKDEDLY